MFVLYISLIIIIIFVLISSKCYKGQYGKYDVVTPPGFLYEKGNLEDRDDRTRPSGPGDPGYVQYTAQRWGQPTTQKTPRHSPTEV